MDSFISGLCSTLSLGSFWSIVGFVVPILAISVLFTLGYNLLNQILIGYNYAQQKSKEDKAYEEYQARKKYLDSL